MFWIITSYHYLTAQASPPAAALHARGPLVVLFRPFRAPLSDSLNPLNSTHGDAFTLRLSFTVQQPSRLRV